MKKTFAVIITALTLFSATANAKTENLNRIFKLEKKFELEMDFSQDPMIYVYRNKISGNCYVIMKNGHKGGFTPVSCEDFELPSAESYKEQKQSLPQ